ncbi:MAG TPA: Crp/Fnr family transcriptional regulator [Burkholderiales bacterium]|nr:Crp/Fnr family transcriptional regulator [Burkholderiales bacterium]
MILKNLLLRLPKGGAEQQAIAAGEIDAIIDHSSSNVILLPAARRALREVAKNEAANEAAIANSVLLRLPKGGAEQQAIAAGEIDAIIDHSSSNVILLPAARRALREVAKNETANEAAIANSLLAGLPHADYQRLLPDLEPLTLRFGEVLHEPGVPIRYVYFPIDCLISLLATVEGDQALEVGLVGYEGMVGISLVLGVDVSSVRARVQATGPAMRMDAARFHQAFRQSLPLRCELYRYAYAKLALARRTVVCNHFHAIEARLARWLLMTSDRLLSKEFLLTQAFLAEILGARRATVNEAAGALQQRKLITCRRGKIRILDRKGLEAASCRCYTKMERAESAKAAGKRPRRKKKTA